jgi:hypothetical protein
VTVMKMGMGGRKEIKIRLEAGRSFPTDLV